MIILLVIFDPAICAYRDLLALFWTVHNPTQGMGQGNDRGTQYRSGIYTHSDQQFLEAQASKIHYQQALTKAGFALITTEIMAAPVFYYAEAYHQQYLAKNPNGYCGLGGLGVAGLPAFTGVLRQRGIDLQCTKRHPPGKPSAVMPCNT